jgi:hypothetical protein
MLIVVIIFLQGQSGRARKVSEQSLTRPSMARKAPVEARSKPAELHLAAVPTVNLSPEERETILRASDADDS